MHDDQRVRTMAGWIGVEISRSRVRTPGKAGYGLYRVRGSEGMCWHDAQQLPRAQRTEDLHGKRGAWTDYAFTLEQIEAQVALAIQAGTPAGPGALNLYRADRPGVADMVPVRWTQAYRGRRDLGVAEVAVPATLKPEAAHRVSALAALVDEGLVAMTHVPQCSCSGTERLTMACVDATMGDERAGSLVRAAIWADSAVRHQAAT